MRILFLSIVGLGVQFQCQLHPCALMLIFGSFVSTLGVWCVLCVGCPGVWVGSFLDALVPIMVACGTLAGEKCCHGLTCRPRESAGDWFLSDLLSLLGYPAGPGAALSEETLKLKYHTFPFARRKRTWKVSTPGHVADILTIGGEETGLVGGFPREEEAQVFLIKASREFDLLRKRNVSLSIGDFRAACSQSRVGFCTTRRMVRILALEEGCQEGSKGFKHWRQVR